MEEKATLAGKERERRRLLRLQLKRGDQTQIAIRCGVHEFQVSNVLAGRSHHRAVLAEIEKTAAQNMAEKQAEIDKLKSY